MAWLLRDDEVLASAELADGWAERLFGPVMRHGIEGVLVVRPARFAHSFGSGSGIDVAFCDGELVVLHTVTLRPYRLCWPRLKASCLIEAEGGAFERWRLVPGDKLTLRGMMPEDPFG
ncbi:MAG: DUF192 domain-containing protein [Acidimicrobiales bacterium]